MNEFKKNNKWPKISIVTPSFNQGAYIEDSIKSVIAQNYPNLEYIIIDGGSTDNTLDIIKKYEEHITYWISEKDQGQSNAINKGLEKCTGEIFNWLNTDDYYESGVLHKIAESFRQHNADIVTGKARILEVDGSTRLIKGHYHGLFHKRGFAESRLFQPSTFIKLNKARELGCLSETLHYVMDVEWYFKYLLYFGCRKITGIDEVLVNYRHHEQSKSIAYKDVFQPEIELLFYHLAGKIGDLNLVRILDELIIKDFIKELDYEMVLDMDNINSMVIKDAISVFLYPYFSNYYVQGDLYKARKLMHFINSEVLYGLKNKRFRQSYWKLKNVYFALATWRKLRSLF